MKLNRRNFCKLGAGAAAATVLSPYHFALAEDGFLEIRAGKSEQSLYPDSPASTLWTYNGTAPGPEIRVRQGERVKVRFINELDEPSSIHWHGVRIVNAMDGVPGLTQKAVSPGESFEYDFVAPDAGTYWYHAHNKSWNQVGRGLYGPLIIEEPYPTFDRDHDITLVIDDWRLLDTGQFDESSMGEMMDWSHAGRLGNWITVNGKSRPDVVLKAGEAYRLRLINVCNARTLELDPNRFDARILAFDGQPLPEPIRLPYQPYLLASAQRVDLLVTPKAGQDFALEELSGNSPFPFLNFRVSDTGMASALAGIPTLKPNALTEPDLAKATVHPLLITGGAMGRFDGITYQGKPLGRESMMQSRQFWAFNGVANLPEQQFFTAKRGETVIVEMVNDTAWPHAMHVHGHHFRIEQREGSEIDEGRPWKDTFLIGPGQKTRIAFVADNPGKWLLHCHMLEHAAAGMTTWFEVV
ncbi:multicopper oxidase family protein [uncultured Cohaesibacter sp.]|uniref:multicopper oxidase family protein n=1 Tax=uncultured Cohaesibacter sp. TaxID=1002546 RepID=UPI0029C78B90|nr:multicopper oxidase family protein [uncultured Cohaesibacter sp.]